MHRKALEHLCQRYMRSTESTSSLNYINVKPIHNSISENTYKICFLHLIGASNDLATVTMTLVANTCKIMKTLQPGHRLQLFLPRDATHKCGLCRHAVSVHPSVCVSRSWVASKWIKISAKCFHHRVAKPFYFFDAKWDCDIPTGTPLTGASNAGDKSCQEFFGFELPSTLLSKRIAKFESVYYNPWLLMMNGVALLPCRKLI